MVEVVDRLEDASDEDAFVDEVAYVDAYVDDEDEVQVVVDPCRNHHPSLVDNAYVAVDDLVVADLIMGPCRAFSCNVAVVNDAYAVVALDLAVACLS